MNDIGSIISNRKLLMSLWLKWWWGWWGRCIDNGGEVMASVAVTIDLVVCVDMVASMLMVCGQLWQFL